MQHTSTPVDTLLKRLISYQRDSQLGYVIAIVLVLLGLTIRLLIAPAEAGLPFLTFFTVATLATIFGGARAGIFSVVLCVILASYFFFPPYRAFVWEFSSETVLSNLAYSLELLLIIVIVETMYQQHDKYQVTAGILEELEIAKRDLQIAAAAFEANEGIIITNDQLTILRVNQAFCAISGYSPEDVLGHHVRILQSGRHPPDFYAAMWQRIDSDGYWEGEIWDKRKNGEIFPKWLTITAIKNSAGAVTHYVATQTDISERKLAEEEIHLLAFFDPLTRLPNRRLLMDRLEQAVTFSHRHGNCVAILFIDLDNFKTLNDSLGHAMGDLLLQQVADRLIRCVREDDTVARLGGDEFMLLLENLSHDCDEAASQVEQIGQKIIQSLGQPYQLQEQTYRSTPSIGATLFRRYQGPVDELFKQADIAMYQSKKAGRNTLRFFDPHMQFLVNQRATLEIDLRHALERQEFCLFYQLQVDNGMQPLGAEALIRWQHPTRGLVFPNDFIPLAEETGLILNIGQWVLNTACAQLRQWQQDPRTRELVLAVNVSPRQLQDEHFINHVKNALTQHAAPAHLLKLEVTESALLDNIAVIAEKMRYLKNIGVQFSLDDFGTGYSSLQYLKLLPLDQLKIDRSFVRDLESDADDRTIVRTIINMANSLQLDVIAEGVENLSQQALLVSKGCFHFQGYLFGKPVPIKEFEANLGW